MTAKPILVSEASRVETEQLKIIKMLLDGTQEHTAKLNEFTSEMVKLTESNRTLITSIDELSKQFSNGFKKDLETCFQTVTNDHENSMREFTNSRVEDAKSTVKITILGGIGVVTGIGASLVYMIYLLSTIIDHLPK